MAASACFTGRDDEGDIIRNREISFNFQLSTFRSFHPVTVAFMQRTVVEPATMVLRNGKIVTVDDAKPEAQAIAIRGDRIAAVGSNDEIQRYVGPGTKVIDLAGQLAIPGLIESHGHFMRLGQSKMMLDLMDVKDWNEIVVDGRGRGEAGEAGRVDSRPRMAPGKVERACPSPTSKAFRFTTS